MIRGMTGFGRSQGRETWGAWQWEVRSVNGKVLDLRVSTPPGHDAVDFEIRRKLKDRFARGSLQLQLRIETSADAASARPLDTRTLAHQARLSRSWARAGLAPSSLDALITLQTASRTVRSAEAADEARTAFLVAALEPALEQLEAARAQEGQAIRALLDARLDDMTGALARANLLAADQPSRIAERFRQRLSELSQGGAAPEPDRVMQEAAILAAKADVREELDRLTAHIGTARSLLAETSPAGRRLDFLCQEFNREANTLASKSAILELTNEALLLKSLIDQFREQVQNVE